MAETEETPSQRQARLRREKREAKIKAGGTERLDKITKLSGRTPESMRNDDDPPISVPTPYSQPTSPPPNLANAASPDQVRAQEEYLRQLLRTPAPQPGQGQQEPGQPGQGDEMEDPMMKMMNQLLGSMGGDAGGEGGLPFSPDDVSKATGLPSFVTDMFLGKGKAPPTPAQEKTARMWTIIHTLFALVASIYVVSIVSRSVDVFGEKAPAPATFQNPFLIFIMGELLVQGGKAVTAGQDAKKGIWLWFQVLKDIARDGSIVVFAMGACSWWQGLS